MIRSLRAKVLLLTAAFGLMLAAGLATVMYGSVFSYYSDWQYQRTQQFLERIASAHPELWREYNNAGSSFGQTLRQYILYSPNTGLYLIDKEGRVLASAGEGRIFWSSFRISLEPLISSHEADPRQPKYGDDPDVQNGTCIVALYPVLDGEEVKGYLYAVARDAVIQVQASRLLGSYAIRTSLKVALITMVIGLALTAAVLASFTGPLARLTQALEAIKAKGFALEDQPGRPTQDGGSAPGGPSTPGESPPAASAAARAGGKAAADSPASMGLPHVDRNDEIGQLSRAFLGLFERLKEEMRTVKHVDHQRRDMIASVSHDLRTPLTALSGQLETIRLKGADMSPEEQRRYVDLAFNNAQHLKRLTDSLADLAKLDNPDFQAKCEPLALGELADDLVQRFRLRAEQQDIELRVEYPDGLPQISLDASLIERALTNLLDNALRVTPGGGRIQVSVLATAAQPGAEGVPARPAGQTLSVSDTGPGVADSERERIFEKFYQTEQHRELRGSAGLGLAIVRRVAQLHRGEVSLDTRPGAGSRFSLFFPAL